MRFTAYGPISKKNNQNLYAYCKKCRSYIRAWTRKADRVKEFEREIHVKAHNAKLDAGILEAFDGPVGVKIHYHPPLDEITVTVYRIDGRFHDRKKDISNFQDVVLDAMQDIIYNNDKQVQFLLIDSD